MKLVRIAAFAIAALAAVPSWAAEGPKWSDWGDDLFSRAAAEKRFVILDLEAVWCHWCHVMEKTTYRSITNFPSSALRLLQPTSKYASNPTKALL